MPASPHLSDGHISSAVVAVLPARCGEVIERLERLRGTEIHRVENGKIAIVLEGRDSGEIGARLAAIALFDGVVAANLVSEHLQRESA